MQKYLTSYNNNNLLKKIDEFKVLSFDIFDTILKRDCIKPSQLFEYMERDLGSNYRGFARIRQECDALARRSCKEGEITLEQIYREVEKRSKWNVDFLLQEEIKYELALCNKNEQIMQIYTNAVNANKIVVFTSDMYLPISTIKKMLRKIGVTTYEKIYLSSELKKTKRTGNLFEYLINDLKSKKLIRNSKEILHIGDDFISDYLKPKLKGMASYKINKNMMNNFIINKNGLDSYSRIEYDTMSIFLSNHCKGSADFYYKIGYETLGPLLYGFCSWINRILAQKNITKVFFMSRDGQVVLKAYDYFASVDRGAYMYASRRAYIVPTLWMCETLNDMYNSMFMPKVGTINAFISKMGLNCLEYEAVVNSYGYRYDEFYSYNKLIREKSFLGLFNTLRPDIVSNSKAEYIKVVRYLKRIGFEGNVSIIDIGWHCNMQKALIKICLKANINVNILGLYVGINPSTEKTVKIGPIYKKVHAKGYLFDKNKNEYLFLYQKNFTSLLEMFFLADHGSLLKFDDNGQPILKPFEYKQNCGFVPCYYKIVDIQEAALQMIRDVQKNKIFIINWSPNVTFQNLITIGNQPNNEVANKFGEFIVLDDTVNRLAMIRPLGEYLKNIRLLVCDYHASSWKIGFFHLLFKINIPYFEIRMMLKYINKLRGENT